MQFYRKALIILAILTGLGQAAATEVEIGYMPILPVSQLFVNLENGDFDKAEIEPKLVEFQNGPAVVQALLAGQLEVAYFGIGPAMVARAKGAPIKVVAANIKEQIGFIALGELADYFESGSAETAFARFTADKGRKPVITTFPQGSVPQIVFEYWLQNQLKIDSSQVEIIYQGAAQVQQSLLAGAVDGAAILDPIITFVLDKVPSSKLVAAGSELFPNQPGAVLVVREELIASNPELVRSLVAAHKQATDSLNKNPNQVAPYVQKWVAGGRLPLAIVEQALVRSKGSFEADPNAIFSGTVAMRDFQKKLSSLKLDLDLNELFDLDFYE